jgi:hypothetical protein
MSEQQELIVEPRGEVAPQPEVGTTTLVPDGAVQAAAEVAASPNGVGTPNRHAEAGRKGAHRVHQLIQEGRLYEKEHGLKRGRQRLRQLIELGKAYELEHGLRPNHRKKRGERLSRLGREELLATLLRCLLRIAKPSFRAELRRLVEVLSESENGRAA